MSDLDRGYTDATPPSDREEKDLEWQKEVEEKYGKDGEMKKPDGFIDRNNYGDRL